MARVCVSSDREVTERRSRRVVKACLAPLREAGVDLYTAGGQFALLGCGQQGCVARLQNRRGLVAKISCVQREAFFHEWLRHLQAAGRAPSMMPKVEHVYWLQCAEQAPRASPFEGTPPYFAVVREELQDLDEKDSVKLGGAELPLDIGNYTHDEESRKKFTQWLLEYKPQSEPERVMRDRTLVLFRWLNTHNVLIDDLLPFNWGVRVVLDGKRQPVMRDLGFAETPEIGNEKLRLPALSAFAGLVRGSKIRLAGG